ncbi:helix-turn-helix transcriptional regulator [Paenibacillus sp. J5C_2022]|uniref:helix-turn-helix transcriptional regulator n=1 Tax=Paenibacillus sp. J5C2022 TaxID=2977129 RepID=UPI0021D131BA|nr:helix-turn-helix transcriptional regulator [Paenibacillus sp. J5C2022]MCU6707839.1 helix-turn-helix transcriptional regulator [Paenibacillus sp. J5C2022]
MRALIDSAQESAVRTERASSEMRDICAGMRAYIMEHCCEGMEMSVLAEQFYVSRSYMYKIFKLCTGYTPYQYLMLERIRQSKRLLLMEELTIAEIACRTGFNHSPHFIRSFKEATGMTPGEYKLMMKSGR